MVAIGSVDGVAARPFEIIRASIAVNAAALILVHNHPSGNPSPSQCDLRLTEDLKKITDLGGMRFLDHVIIGEEGYYSFSEEGRI